MIVQLLFEVIFGLVETLINMIPTITLPDSFVVGMSDVTALVSVFAYFVPLGTLSLCLSVIFVLQNARFIVSIFNFIIRKIPGLS